MSSRVLIVEDEESLAGILQDYLRRDGFEAQTISNGDEAMEFLRVSPPDLVILDLMLPGMDGLSILKELRKFSTLPVIIVTAKVEEIDRLLGLELGADDYVCKPYSPREVVLRVKMVLRRLAQPSASDSTYFVMNPAQWLATLDGRRLDLTPKEFRLLEVLMSNPGRVFSRSKLLDEIYKDNLDVSDRAVDSHLKNLRRKIAEVREDFDPIRSIYGVGFVFELQD
jgi:two-component system, OmpR family, response regulator BaeR